MPNKPYLYATDFIETLKKKHAAETYKEMVKFSKYLEWFIGFLNLMVISLCNYYCDDVM